MALFRRGPGRQLRVILGRTAWRRHQRGVQADFGEIRRCCRNPETRQKEKTTALEDFSLAEYAFAKHLPEEWLAKTCRLETRKDRSNGTAWLYIPYYNAAGEESTYRKRYAHKDFRWRTGSSGKICLYGEWRIPEFANAGYAVMVEGESDTQSLWYMGIPAIGVPGASMFKPEQSSVLQGLKLYLHHEPDGGGDTFIHKICTGLRDGGYEGEVYEWSCKALGEKDPSDLYIKHGREQAAKLIRDALKTAKPVDYKKRTSPKRSAAHRSASDSRRAGFTRTRESAGLTKRSSSRSSAAAHRSS